MIPLEEARDYVLSVATRRDPSMLAVSEVLGLVLAEQIVSDEAIPPFPNTAMDGFAVRSVD
ncbi:MAG: molybdopterin molybdenumtransferase MoeA, partial [Actinomycetota bacterium]|nr:molybdopterin molybdenumtransferase MoeA [Actinomycetota bacterium]